MEMDSEVCFDEHGMSQIELHCIENVIWVIFLSLATTEGVKIPMQPVAKILQDGILVSL